MNPGIAVMPCASMVSTAETFGVPAATEASRPFRMTMEPRSMTVPFPIMIRAFVITRFWADSLQFPDRIQNQAGKVSQTALFIFCVFVFVPFCGRSSVTRLDDVVVVLDHARIESGDKIRDGKEHRVPVEGRPKLWRSRVTVAGVD